MIFIIALPLMILISVPEVTHLQFFELCVGLIPENVLTPSSGSYERNLNEQLSSGCLMQAWHTEMFFTFRNVERDMSHNRLHVFKVVNPSLRVSFPHFSKRLVLVGSRPQYLPGKEELVMFTFSFIHVALHKITFYKK